MGAVLAQRKDGHEVAVAYWSKALNPQQSRYSTTEREGLAIYEAVKHFRHYLATQPFVLVTDHASLRYLLSFKDPTHRINRWVMYLQTFDFIVVHRSGPTNGNADGLSRARGPEATVNPNQAAEYEAWLRSIGIPDVPAEQPREELAQLAAVQAVGLSTLPPMVSIAEAQQAEPVLKAYVQHLQHGDWEGVPSDIIPLCVDLQSYTVVDGILYHYLEEGKQKRLARPGRLQLVVPRSWRKVILTAYHDNSLKGHPSVERTYLDLRQRYYWLNMYADVVAFVRSCPACGQVKWPRRGASAGLKPVTLPGVGGPRTDAAGDGQQGVGEGVSERELTNSEREWGQSGAPAPFQMIGMDFVGPLTTSANGNSYILVVTCYVTRWAEAFALHDCTAQSVAKVLVKRIFLQYRVPDVILSDRGSHFVNEVVDAMISAFQARHVLTSGYRPQTAGLVERLNQTLVGLLRLYTDEHRKDWDLLLPYILFAYRTTYHEAIGCTPYFLLYGVEPVIPTDLHVLPLDVRSTLADQERHQVLHRLREARRLAATRLSEAQAKMKASHDKGKPAPLPYKVGDQVRAYKPQGQGKFAKPYSGPYRVERVDEAARNLHLVAVADGEVRVCHMDNVKPYVPCPTLRPEGDVEPEVAIPTEQQVDRTLTHLEHVLRRALRLLPLERLRPTLARALGDEYQRIPELQRGMAPPTLQPLPTITPEDLAHLRSLPPPDGVLEVPRAAEPGKVIVEPETQVQAAEGQEVDMDVAGLDEQALPPQQGVEGQQVDMEVAGLDEQEALPPEQGVGMEIEAEAGVETEVEEAQHSGRRSARSARPDYRALLGLRSSRGR